ncbi:DUF803-domain-containing protein [Lepidopterella palustris CBS 459.81]|uniref:DUF803-domain-containing protein n=1 Tax=Lepidopterella palustris CBS 459.81 TaxID=1314670 RepID=A0A8E2E920_9PEZI|nr:DUF803-domain-containing protein [Lepidopterella palustris CBS 459.81]
MIIPSPYDVAGSATSTIYGPPTPTPSSIIPGIGGENWSSLIGIVTAIIGNILISFALNMQRYAHIQLNREWEEMERLRKGQSKSYGTNQETVAEERAKANLAPSYSPPQHAGYGNEEEDREDEGYGHVASESDPLIPSMSPVNGRLRSRRASRTCSDTAASRSAASSRAEAAFKQKSYLKSPYWWTGIVMMTVGEAGNFLAYGFAPASIVSPLGVVALISNCIIAPFLLKEPFRKRDGLGVFVAVAGAVTVVLSASNNNPKLGPDEMWDLIGRWEFETYLGITVAVIVGLMLASNKYGGKSIFIDLGLVGLFGGYTALSTKGVASLLSYTLWRAITFPIFYLLTAILIFTAVMQIKYINRALQRFDATQVIPTQFVLFTLSVILGSAILYRDFEKTPGDDAGKFVGGCAMTFIGVWFITSGRPRGGDEDEEQREPEPQDSINLISGERYQASSTDGPEHLEAGTSSRRSSTLRASSPPTPTGRSARGDSPPATPVIRLTPDDTTAPPTPSPGTDGEPSSLASNPWDIPEAASSPSPSPILRPAPAPLITTNSIPVLPSETSYAPASASTPRPTTPRGLADAGAVASPSTGPRLRRSGTAERLGGDRDRDKLAARNSIAGPLLTSPLSSSLSAVVAELRRGGSVRSHHNGHTGNGEYTPSRRRESAVVDGEEEDDAGGDVRERARRGTDGDGHRSGGRGRSVSGTLGDLWRGIRGSAGASEEDLGREWDGGGR